MVIPVVGSGNVGSTLARLWTAAGYEVRIAGRQNCAQTILPSDVVALCVPWSAAEAALASCGDLAGKTFDRLHKPNKQWVGRAGSQWEHFGGGAHPNSCSRCVHRKAFNTIGASMLGNTGLEGGVADGFFCGDSATAKEVVSKLIVATALRPVDVGPLRNARYLEAMAMLWVDLAVNQKKGPTFAFTVAGWGGAAQ